MPERAASRAALLVAILGSSMAFLDATVVNVALPVMQRELDVSIEIVQWIVEAYALFLAALVLVGGALGDQLGRKKVFLAGVIAFAVASIGCGAAPNGLVLIAMRAIQGIGAALLVPGSLAIISAAFTKKEDRGAAIGTWSAASAITGAIGPVAGGFVVAHASWRWLFFFNVPVALAVVALSTRFDETRDPNAPKKIDWTGALLAALGLGLVVYSLIESESRFDARIGGLLALGIVIAIAFVLVEARHAAPMVPLFLFRSRTFAGTNLLTLLLYAALGGGLFFLPFNLIQVHHYSPQAAGASLLPLILTISVMSRWMGELSQRWGPRAFLVVGPSIAGAGFALLALPNGGGSYWSTFFPGVLVLGIGMGVTVAPLTSTVMGCVDEHHAGTASGINNAVARAAGLVAIAALGVILHARFNHVLDATLPSELASIADSQRSKLAAADFSDSATAGILRPLFDAAYVAAFRAVMLVCAGLSVAGALSALVLVESK